MSEGPVPAMPDRPPGRAPRPRPGGGPPSAPEPPADPPAVVPPLPASPPPAPLPLPPALPRSPADLPQSAAGAPAQEYSSTVVAPAQIGLGVVIGLVLALVLVEIRTGLWPFAIVGFLVVVAASSYVASVQLLTTRTYLEIGQGRGDRDPRRIGYDDIERASVADLTWGQCFGFGMPRGEPTTRLSVRPGPTLILELRDGEIVRVSTPDPAAALAAGYRRGNRA